MKDVAKLFFLFLLITLFQYPIANSRTEEEQPRIEIEEPYWDFGFIPFDYDMVHFFKVKNTGNANLIMFRAASNCDCTTARILDTLLSPGESTLIRVDFWTTDYYGTNVRQITVESNDPLNPVLELEYNSNIGALPTAFSANPKSLFFLPSQTQKTISLSNQSGKKAQYKILLEADSLISVESLEGEIAAGESVELAVTLNPEIPKGTVFTSFHLIFRDDKEIKTTVPIKIVKY